MREWVSQLADESAGAAGSSAGLAETRQLRRLAEGWSEFDPTAAERSRRQADQPGGHRSGSRAAATPR